MGLSSAIFHRIPLNLYGPFTTRVNEGYSVVVNIGCWVNRIKEYLKLNIILYL